MPDKRRLKIVHIVSSLKVGGMERFVLNIAAAQQSAGTSVSVMALQDGPLHAVADHLDIRTFIPSGSSKYVRAAKAAIYLAKLKPHLIHAHNRTSLHYAAVGRKVCGARILVTNHGAAANMNHFNSLKDWDCADVVVSVSHASASALEQMSGMILKRSTVIHNGVHMPVIVTNREAVRKSLGLSKKDVVGIIVARIDGYKGHDCLLAALAKMRTCPEFKLIIAGDGVDRQKMQNLAESLEIGNASVQFLGFRDDVAALLGAADIFLLPSLSEGLPLSILEAMSHGLPIVATPVGGIPETIDDNIEGLIVPVNDSDGLAVALQTLVSNPDLRERMGAAGKMRASTAFSFDAMKSAYDRLYSSVLALEPEHHKVGV